MELDFSTDGSPEASFESAAPGSAADGTVEVVVCGVPLRIFQGEGLGGRQGLIHSSTFQLNLSAVYGLGAVRMGSCSPC